MEFHLAGATSVTPATQGKMKVNATSAGNAINLLLLRKLDGIESMRLFELKWSEWVRTSTINLISSIA